MELFIPKIKKEKCVKKNEEKEKCKHTNKYFNYDKNTAGVPNTSEEEEPVLNDSETYINPQSDFHRAETFHEDACSQKPTFCLNNPPPRSKYGNIVEKEEDFEYVYSGSSINKELKKKKKKKKPKDKVKLTSKPIVNSKNDAKIYNSLVLKRVNAKKNITNTKNFHPMGRKTLLDINNMNDYDVLEYPHDESVVYQHEKHDDMTMCTDEQEEMREGYINELNEYEEWSSNSDEDVEEAIKRIACGVGSVDALMADGSTPSGIFCGDFLEDRKNHSHNSGFYDDHRAISGHANIENKKEVKRGRKSEGLDIRKVPFDKVVLADELLKELDKNETFFDTEKGNEYDGDGVMIYSDPIGSEMMLTTNKNEGGKTIEISKGIPVVSPLTKFKQMFIKASRLPEEVSVIARAKELDDIQTSIRFGNLNMSEIDTEVNIEDYVHSGIEIPDKNKKAGKKAKDAHDENDDGVYMNDNVYRDTTINECDKDSSYNNNTHRAYITHIGSEGDEEGTSRRATLSFDIDIDSDAYGSESFHTDKDKVGVDEFDFEKESQEEHDTVLLNKKMKDLTQKMIKHEKNVKRIVSDYELNGLNKVLMKGTVLDIFMFDVLECIRKRPNETILKTDGSIINGNLSNAKYLDGSNLLAMNASNVVWKEKDIFSLCSQLVSLQSERDSFRSRVCASTNLYDGISDGEKQAILGDPCDMTYCEKYFRPPVGTERPCIWETECVCYLIGQYNIFPDTLDRVVSDTSFIGREFYTPDEEREFHNSGWPKEKRACLLCYDIAMLYAYYYYKRNDQSAPFLLQNHWNKIEGEFSYGPSLCFPLVDNDTRWTGFIAPKVMRILSSLRPYKTNVYDGVSMKKVSCFVEVCQDFWLASTALEE